MGTVRFTDIQQGDRGTCAILATAPDNLQFRRQPKGKVAFCFYDRFTGQAQWTTIKSPSWRTAGLETSAARNSSDAIERAYGKFLRTNNYRDDLGATGLDAASNGNRLNDTFPDMTNRFKYRTDLDRIQAGSLLSSSANSQYFAANHAYRVVGASADSITVFNPWGRDGRAIVGADDGFVTMGRSEFAADFRGVGYR